MVSKQQLSGPGAEKGSSWWGQGMERTKPSLPSPPYSQAHGPSNNQRTPNLATH